jgi:ATPase
MATNKTISSGVEKLASDKILQFFRRYDSNAVVKILGPSKAQVFLDEAVIPKVIGKGGAQIKEAEEALSIGLDVRPREVPARPEGRSARFDYREKGNSLEIFCDPDSVGNQVTVYVGNDPVLTTIVSRKAKIKLSKKSEAGRKIERALRDGKEIKVQVS